MLILGDKYKFTKLELERLNKKFNNIDVIIDTDKSTKNIIEEIEFNLNKTKNSYNIFLLNTKKKTSHKIIKYITKLKYQSNNSKLNIISIEHFLEKYLLKCYIPESNNNLYYFDDIEEYTLLQNFQKKIVDIIAMFFLFIFFFIIKFKIKAKIEEESPGNIYYLQKRIGLRNKEFICIKFRSMEENAEENGIQFSSKNDYRKFSFGKVMRDTRIDELPQVFNILKGEMSCVGPRPERGYWIEKDFESQIPYYNHRHIVKPGITGLAQVMYPYGNGVEDARQKLMYDLYYIKHWNIFLELQIVWKTIIVVLYKKGT